VTRPLSKNQLLFSLLARDSHSHEQGPNMTDLAQGARWQYDWPLIMSSSKAPLISVLQSTKAKENHLTDNRRPRTIYDLSGTGFTIVESQVAMVVDFVLGRHVVEAQIWYFSVNRLISHRHLAYPG
jgi:hypothetical protein